MVGVSAILGNNLVTMALFSFAAISGWVGPLLTPKIGHRGIGIAGFSIVLVSLLIAAAATPTISTSCRSLRPVCYGATIGRPRTA